MEGTKDKGSNSAGTLHIVKLGTKLVAFTKSILGYFTTILVIHTVCRKDGVLPLLVVCTKTKIALKRGFPFCVGFGNKGKVTIVTTLIMDGYF